MHVSLVVEGWFINLWYVNSILITWWIQIHFVYLKVLFLLLRIFGSYFRMKQTINYASISLLLHFKLVKVQYRYILPHKLCTGLELWCISLSLRTSLFSQITPDYFMWYKSTINDTYFVPHSCIIFLFLHWHFKWLHAIHLLMILRIVPRYN